MPVEETSMTPGMPPGTSNWWNRSVGAVPGVVSGPWLVTRPAFARRLAALTGTQVKLPKERMTRTDSTVVGPADVYV